MALLDSILGAASGKTDASGEANSLVGILGGLLTQSGGLHLSSPEADKIKLFQEHLRAENARAIFQE